MPERPRRGSLRDSHISIANLTALGFAVGSAVHTTAFVLISVGVYLYGPTYPAWRHVVMASADVVIAWIALGRPRWLVVAMSAWVIEQTIVNGFGVLCALSTIAIVAHAVQRSRAVAKPVAPL